MQKLKKHKKCGYDLELLFTRIYDTVSGSRFCPICVLVSSLVKIALATRHSIAPWNNIVISLVYIQDYKLCKSIFISESFEHMHLIFITSNEYSSVETSQ